VNQEEKRRARGREFGIGG